ncbi:hypothetical protein CBLAS_0230 [Campylobacter blaseri]|uniref:CYTH domain-containing protein n=1 Tax=Campylobacter blaseri TaxID=2042961 RepID=A0A2P8R164_9BACT|nr:hypothetical protein [Campylobacter blaseri]PSM52236.1 hypothetical protein CQ405_04055 [Campylobacter blaseri]PSM54002.1 hypothetical protein CRN67_04055 [Campylobacter blaseri]QKF85440.1 hypothetical protein CBLAS_0230 [Campylobacter blaseri]
MKIGQKFLLENVDIFHRLTNYKIELNKFHIEYFYLQLDEDIKIAYKKENLNYYCIVENKNETNKDSRNIVLKSKYKKAKKSRISQLIVKERYKFVVDEINFDLDVYLRNLSGLIILIAERGSINGDISIENRKIFKDLNLKEITDDECFSTENLVLWGNPNINFNFAQSLLAIKKNPTFKLNFPGYIDAYDGFRLALNQNVFNILRAKESYIEYSELENLKKLEILFLQNMSLLIISKELFEKDTYNDLFQNIREIYIKIKDRYDAEKNIKYFQKRDNTENIVKSLKFVKAKQYSNNFLKSSEFTDFLLDYEIFLTINNNFYKNRTTELKRFVVNYIYNKVSKIKDKLEYINEDSINRGIYECKQGLMEFETVLNIFNSIFDLSIFKKTLKKVKKLNKSLIKLEYKDELHKIINMYDKGDINKSLDVYRKNTAIDIFKHREKFLDNKDSFIKSLNKIENLIKIYY